MSGQYPHRSSGAHYDPLLSRTSAPNSATTYNIDSSQLTFLRTQASSVLGSSSIVVKFLCVTLVICYFISFSSQALDILAVLPGNLLPPNFWVWTCVTYSFFEVHWWMVICDLIVVILCGKLLEPLWGALEMVRFYFIVNIAIALLTSLTYLVVYFVTDLPDYLFKQHIHGLAGYLAGFAVAVKQSMSDQVLVNSPFGKLRNRHIPLWVLLVAILFRLVGGVDPPFPVMFAWGLIVSWIYLRFYQRHSNGNIGDMADSFSFASFFPDMAQPVVAVLSNTLFSLLVTLKLCKKQPSRRFETSTPAPVLISLPGTDSHDAERRRQLALKALNERLSKAPATSWPDLDDSETSPAATAVTSLAATDSTSAAPAAVAISDPSVAAPASTAAQNSSVIVDLTSNDSAAQQPST